MEECGDKLYIRGMSVWWLLGADPPVCQYALHISHRQTLMLSIPQIRLVHYPPHIYTGHVLGPTCHYDVIYIVFVAKRRDRTAWQQSQYQWRHNGKYDML